MHTAAARTPASTRSRGQGLVEFALISPIFLLFLLIAVDFGRMFFSYVEVSNAAREAAAYAASNPTDLAGIITHAEQETSSQAQGGEHTLVVSASCADPSGVPLVGGCATAPGGSGIGNSVTVGVTEPFSFLTPFINGFFSNSFSIQASASTAVLSLAATGGGGPGTCTTGPTSSFAITVDGMSVTLDASGIRTHQRALRDLRVQLDNG